MHTADCVHVHLGVGAWYCETTKLVYVRPDLIHLAALGITGKRPSEAKVFARRIEQLAPVMSNIPILGYVLCSPKVPLSNRPQDLGHYIDYLHVLRTRREQAREVGKSSSGQCDDGTPEGVPDES